MMLRIFVTIINMSISASWMVLAVLLLRLAFKRVPKWMTVALWGFVAVRLIYPFSFESLFSLNPSAETIDPDVIADNTSWINAEYSLLNITLDQVRRKPFDLNTESSIELLQVMIPILVTVWLGGMLGIVIYTVISYFRLRRETLTAVRFKDNIYQSECVVSPFVFGIIQPRIYLPYQIAEKDMAHVVAHEQAHIRRKDHLWKPLGFLLLTIHWFNPLMWIAYILFCRDMELACDQKVIKSLERDARADYSQALLTVGSHRHKVAACPLAFSEVGVIKRVISVLSYKKPALWIIIVAVIASLFVAVSFLTDPINEDNMGVKSISAQSLSADVVELNIKYSYPTGRYSVRSVPEGEGEYCGDGMVDYDGSLGKYRIIINFGDTDPTESFMEKYPAGEVVDLKDSSMKMKIKWVCPQDHGFAIYVGFDRPVDVEELAEELDATGGTVKIPIRVASPS